MTPPKIGIKKILCVKESFYKEIVEILKEVFPKIKRQRKERRKKETAKKQEKSINRSYEASEIWNTRDSKYWSWIRAYEWFNRYGKEDDEKELELELKELGVI